MNEKHPAEEACHHFLVYKSRVVRARLQAHGIDPASMSLLALQLLTFARWEGWLGQPAKEKSYFARAIRLAKDMARAALANRSVMAQVQAGHGTKEAIDHNPPIRLRFEEASCLAPLGDALHATRHKSWGKCVGIFPVAPDAGISLTSVGYFYHANSRYNRRFEQRRRLRKALGRFAKLVQSAMRQTKKDFLAFLEVEPWGRPGATEVIRKKLGLDPGRFWRVAKGLEFIEFPQEWLPLDLFKEIPHEERLFGSLHPPTLSQEPRGGKARAGLPVLGAVGD